MGNSGGIALKKASKKKNVPEIDKLKIVNIVQTKRIARLEMAMDAFGKIVGLEWRDDQGAWRKPDAETENQAGAR